MSLVCEPLKPNCFSVGLAHENKQIKPRDTVWVVLYRDRDDKAPSGALKALSSKYRAKAYCEETGKKWLSEPHKIEGSGFWANDYTYVLAKPNGETICTWVLEETIIDDEIVSTIDYSPIEKENEALRKECSCLREAISDVTQRNAAAACYATMWDGGRDYTKDAVLDNLFAVREILAGDHKKVREMYERWKKNEEEMA